MFTSVRNKVVVVTGGSQGIGKGIAKKFAQMGAKVLIISRNEANAKACVNELCEQNYLASYYCADVSNLDEMEQAAKYGIKVYGQLDFVCINAGVYPSATIETMSSKDWDYVNNVNLKGSFISVKAFLEHVKNSEYGRFILTSSITGPITGYPGWSHYGATKAGQLGFMRTAALELAKHKITINAVLPGNIVTESLAELGDDYLSTMEQSIPLNKLGTVDDIANTVLFLTSKEAGYITGQTIIVDGGQILPESLEALS